MQCARTKLLHGTINFAKQKNNLLYNNTLNTFIMKLKSIIALALVALMASCTLNSRLRKLEKAAEDGDAKKAVEILEKIEKKYDEPKDWVCPACGADCEEEACPVCGLLRAEAYDLAEITPKRNNKVIVLVAAVAAVVTVIVLKKKEVELNFKTLKEKVASKFCKKDECECACEEALEADEIEENCEETCEE